MKGGSAVQWVLWMCQDLCSYVTDYTCVLKLCTAFVNHGIEVFAWWLVKVKV